jgi:hypothetical protein
MTAPVDCQGERFRRLEETGERDQKAAKMAGRSVHEDA